MDTMDCLQRGEVLDADEAECYAVIKEQAETFMAQAEIENWTEEVRRERMLAWTMEPGMVGQYDASP